MFALDDPWHKDDNTRSPIRSSSAPQRTQHTHTHIRLLRHPLASGQKEQLVGHGSLQRVNLNFAGDFSFLRSLLRAGEERCRGCGGNRGERGPLWSIVICGWKFWICLQPLRAYPFPSVACAPLFCAPIPFPCSHYSPFSRTCRMRIYIFSCSALLLSLFLCSTLSSSPFLSYCLPPFARFESFKRNIVEITLCLTNCSIGGEIG